MHLYDETGAEYTVTAAASRHIYADIGKFAGIGFLKVRSGTSGTPVNQGVDRNITLAARSL